MAELVTRRIELDVGELRTIYLGGGTPSKLGGAGISSLLAGFARTLGVDDLSTIRALREVTIEANPEDITPEAAEAWVRAGVNRVSLGAQSFDPKVLEWMHRGHGAGAVGAAVETLRHAGLSDISLDLIFALPSDLSRDWKQDMDLALGLGPTHLSLYGLTVEPRAPLGRKGVRGEVVEAPEERYADEFLAAHERLTGAGMEHYEVSNFSLPGRRAQHNSAYWNGTPYLGLGPSAHGFDGSRRRWNIAAFQSWSESVRAGEDPMEGDEEIGPAERIAEEVYLGLRTSDGLSIHQTELKTVMSWISAGWGTLDGDRLRLTPTGWLRLDSIAAALTSLRSPS